MFQGIGAVIAGYVAMVVIVITTTILATRVFMGPSEPGKPCVPGGGYLSANLVCGLAAAILGGFVCAWIADGNLLIHTCALAVFVLVMAIISARGGQSGTVATAKWYPFTIGAIGVAGVLIGGGLRVWVEGRG